MVILVFRLHFLIQIFLISKIQNIKNLLLGVDNKQNFRTLLSIKSKIYQTRSSELKYWTTQERKKHKKTEESRNTVKDMPRAGEKKIF